MLEDYKKFFEEFCETVVEANEPRLIVFHGYVNEDTNEMSVLQVHPDADSMMFHMQLIADHITKAFDVLDRTTSVQVYGTPKAGVVEMIKELSQEGVTVNVNTPFTGFNRLPAL